MDRLGRVVRLALIMFALLSVAFIVASLFVMRSVQTQKDLAELAVSMEDIQNKFLNTRTSALMFLDRKALDDVDFFKKQFQQVQEAVALARENPSILGEDIELLDEIEKNLSAFGNNFTDVIVAQQIKMGLSMNQGLSGAFRNAAHEAEDIARKSSAADLLAAILQMRRHEKDYILRSDDSFISQLGKELENANRQATRLDPASQQKISTLLATYNKNFSDYVAANRLKNRATVDGRVAGAAIAKPLPELVERSSERQVEASNRTRLVIVVTSVTLLAAFVGLGLLLRNAQKAANATFAERLLAQQRAEAENEGLNNSVISILQAVNQISQRDLTVKAPVTQDVIGTVSDSINALTDETARVLQGVTDIAGQVEQVSNKVKSQADVVSHTAQDERQSVQQMLESLLDTTQTMNQVAALAEQSNASAEQATEVTDNALETVTDTVKGMESIRETISETEKRIKRLGERSQEISGIVNLINTISERTHVLALNASMQAAVAGEAGRGFAVVAEEVQRLAESSRNATQQIATLVGNIQLETNETISTVNRTIGQVVQGSEQAQKAGEQMRHTQEITSQLVSQVRSIAHASEQQKTMSAQLLEAVQRIGESTEQTAQQIDAQNKETDTLLAASRRLVESVNVFKLPQAA